MELGKTLKKLREEYQFTQSDLAARLGMSQGTYSIWEKKATNPTVELLMKLSEVYDLPLNVFFSSHTELEKLIDFFNTYQQLSESQKATVDRFTKFLSEEKVLEYEKTATETKVIPLTYQRSELYEVEVADEELSAGFGSGVNGRQETYTVYTDKRPSRYDGAARIRGESMQPEIPDYSIVTFLNTGFQRDGAIYVISEGAYGEEELYCKQVFRDEEGFRCHSLNLAPRYKDFYLQEEARILGEVVDCFEEIDPDLITD